MAKKSFDAGLGGADVASGRAAFYDLLVGVFDLLPGPDLLGKIKSGEKQHVLASCRESGVEGFRSGLDLISFYQSAIRERPDEEVLTELSVDRTRILRGTGPADMLPPYEALYKKRDRFGDSALEVKRFYRRAGLLPDETVRESADYLCVELDFMRQLCLREEAPGLSEGEARQTVALEEEFLRVHLGNWVEDFCSAVEKHALTDFYRGFGLILGAYIRTDKKWLMYLAR